MTMWEVRVRHITSLSHNTHSWTVTPPRYHTGGLEPGIYLLGTTTGQGSSLTVVGPTAQSVVDVGDDLIRREQQIMEYLKMQLRNAGAINAELIAQDAILDAEVLEIEQ